MAKLAVEGEVRSEDASEAVNLAALVERLTKRLDESDKLNEALNQKLERMNTMKMAGTGREKLRAMVAGENRSFKHSADYRDPTALTRPGFKDDDIVRLKEDSERALRIRTYLEKAGELEVGKKLPPGIITGYMYTTRKGLRKYKVDFPGIGEDGIAEDELELA